MDTKQLEAELSGIAGGLVTTSPFERWYYERDLVRVPGAIKAMLETSPAAVVKPRTAAQIGAVLAYCSRRRLPVVARGGGSSGLLGAVPKKGGIVLDLRDLDTVTEVNRQEETVTAGAGLTWWELDRRLSTKGLALKSYPASARSATLGGWIAGSGLGIGSLKYGPVSGHIIRAELALADGSIKEYSPGSGLEAFPGSEGTLGVLTSVTLKARQVPDKTAHLLFYFDDINRLFGFLGELAAASLVPYNLEINDSKYLALVRAAGYGTTEYGPDGGTVLITCDGSEDEATRATEQARALALGSGGQERPGAEEEWAQRFNILRIGRAAPTALPASVHLPLKNLGEFYRGLRRVRHKPIGLVGYVISASEAMLMPLVVTDWRRPAAYTLALHTPGEIADLAISSGGRPGGGLGVWNAPYRRQVMSRGETLKARKIKKALDPQGILNPGMGISPPLLFRPRVYRAATAISSTLLRVIPAGARKAPEKGSEGEFTACVQCGYCMGYCPTRGLWLSSTPRGRILATKEPAEKGPQYLESIFQCSLCGRCRVDCSVDIRSPRMWVDLRRKLVKGGQELPELAALTASLSRTHNLAAKPNEGRAKWAAALKFPYVKETAHAVYFAGCVSSFYPMVQDIARSFARLLNASATDFALLGGEEWCCGYPFISAGHPEEASASMKHNIERVKALGAETVLVTCPGCYRMWKEEYEQITGEKIPFEVLHSTQYIARLIREGKITLGELTGTVTYHDPCDLGRISGILDEPREIMAAIPGLKLIELADNGRLCTCCGSGGDLLASYEDLSMEIARRKVGEIQETGAPTLVTACPSCARAITMARNQVGAGFEVLDIAQLAWKAASK